MTPSSILKGTAVLLFLQGVSVIALNLLGLSFPPALLGMLLLLALLLGGVVKEADVDAACEILIAKMGMLFLPAGVSILLYADLIMSESVAIIMTVVISSAVILLVTAAFLEFMLKHRGGKAQ